MLFVVCLCSRLRTSTICAASTTGSSSSSCAAGGGCGRCARRVDRRAGSDGAVPGRLVPISRRKRWTIILRERPEAITRLSGRRHDNVNEKKKIKAFNERKRNK